MRLARLLPRAMDEMVEFARKAFVTEPLGSDMVLVAMRFPTVRYEDDAEVKDWLAVHELEWAKLRSKLTVPDVVIGFVPLSDIVEFGEPRVIEVTVPVFVV